MSKAVKIEDVKPGVIIDKDVTNIQGAILLKKGNEVTDRHIAIFKMWAINTIFIQDEVGPEDLQGRSPEEVAQEKLEELTKILDEKFADVIDNEVMQSLKALSLTHRSNMIRQKYNV